MVCPRPYVIEMRPITQRDLRAFEHYRRTEAAGGFSVGPILPRVRRRRASEQIPRVSVGGVLTTLLYVVLAVGFLCVMFLA
ncbi:hypothetical protein [Nocardia takedensis]|uniref:hypothetical protein n=1 Tax=Nocardia takedensis TaxID=259390 RepID=UPI000594B2C0|nr:hypothetical protein [Nocardia takedensis]